MTAETLHLNYIRGMLGANVAYTTATDVNIVAVPALVHVITIDVQTVSSGGNALVYLIDATSGDTAAKRWAFQTVETGIQIYVLPKPIFFAVGVRAFLDQRSEEHTSELQSR